MNVSALIQVRMKSKRLPGKALLHIEGAPVLEHIIANLKRSKYLDDVVICTTREREDDPLEVFAKNRNIPIYRGETDNVIDRFCHSARQRGVDVVVRITGDCPAVGSEATDILIQSHMETNADYTSVEPNIAPVGAFPQVISYEALQRLATYDLDFGFSEYMVYYFTNNPKYFSLNMAPVPPEYKYPKYRLTLDYEEDLLMFNRLFSELRKDKLDVNLRNILVVLNRCPEISNMNSHLIVRYQYIYDDMMAKIQQATTIKTALKDMP